MFITPRAPNTTASPSATPKVQVPQTKSSTEVTGFAVLGVILILLQLFCGITLLYSWYQKRSNAKKPAVPTRRPHDHVKRTNVDGQTPSGWRNGRLSRPFSQPYDPDVSTRSRLELRPMPLQTERNSTRNEESRSKQANVNAKGNGGAVSPVSPVNAFDEYNYEQAQAQNNSVAHDSWRPSPSIKQYLPYQSKHGSPVHRYSANQSVYLIKSHNAWTEEGSGVTGSGTITSTVLDANRKKVPLVKLDVTPRRK